MQRPLNLGMQVLRLADWGVHTELGRLTEGRAPQTEVASQDTPQLDVNVLWYEMQSRWLTEAFGALAKNRDQAEGPMHSRPALVRASQDVSIDIASTIEVSIVEKLQQAPKQRIEQSLRSSEQVKVPRLD
jgi:hypothetical protein